MNRALPYLLIASVSLGGCASIKEITIPTRDRTHNYETMQVSPVPLEESQRLTLVFNEILFADEKNVLSKSAQSMSNEDISGPNYNRALGAAHDIASYQLMHTNVWQNALASGDVVKHGLLTVSAAMLAETLLHDDRPSIKRSGFNIQIDAPLSESELIDYSKLKAEKVISSFTEYLVKNGYALDKVAQCVMPEGKGGFYLSNSSHALQIQCNEITNLTFNLNDDFAYRFYFDKGDNNKIHDFDIYEPSRLFVELFLEPLSQSKDPTLNGAVIYSEPGAWQVNLFSANKNSSGVYYEQYRGFTAMEGTDFHRAFFAHMTNEVDGLYSLYRSKPTRFGHISECHYKGRLYHLEEELTENLTIVEGEITNYQDNNQFFD